MKINSAKIRSLVVSVALALGLTLVLSSCSTVLDLVDSVFGEALAESDVVKDNGNNKNDGDGTDTNKPVGGNDSSSGTGTGSSNTQTPDDSDEIEFYPGQGSVPAENISAKNRAVFTACIIIHLL